MKYFNKLGLIALLSVLMFSSCKKDEDENNSSVEVRSNGVLLEVGNDEDAFYPLHYIANAEAGEADIVNASEVPNSEGVIMLFMKDGYAYVNDYTGETFKKLQIAEDGSLTDVGRVPNLGVGGSPLYTFLDGERLLMSSTQPETPDGVISYQIINTSTMTEESTGTFTLPVKGTNGNSTYAAVYANAYVNFGGKIYIPFVETDEDYTLLYEKASVGVYNASTMAYEKVIYADKTSSLLSGFSSGAATSESGDLYMSSSNTNEWAYDQSVPSGIVRIKSGETKFDADYFLDITAATGFHSLGMVYAGNDRAVVQVFNDLSDTDFYIEYYVADLASKTMTKLDVPASDSPVRRSFTLLDNGNVAIISNNATENTLYIYNSISGVVTKGLTYTGTDAIFSVIASK